MANIKSAKKRVLVSQAKADRNKSARSKVKTYIKKVESAVAAGDKAAAQAAVVEAESVMRRLHPRVFIMITLYPERSAV